MAKSKQEKMRERMSSGGRPDRGDGQESGARGLGIIPEAQDAASNERIATPDIEIDLIDFNPEFDYQRQYYDPVLMADLRAEMERVGQRIAPIQVCQKERGQGRYGRYWLVYGSRRLRIAKELGWTRMRADILPPMSRLDHSIAQFQENHVRASCTMSEDAIHIARMLGGGDEKATDVVRRLAMEPSHVSEMHSLGLILLELTPQEQMRLHELDCLGTALRADLAPLAKEDMERAVRIVRKALDQAILLEATGGEKTTGGRKRRKVNPTVETEQHGLVRITRKLKGGNFTLGFSRKKLEAIEDWESARREYEAKFQDFLAYMEQQFTEPPS